MLKIPGGFVTIAKLRNQYIGSRGMQAGCFAKSRNGGLSGSLQMQVYNMVMQKSHSYTNVRDHFRCRPAVTAFCWWLSVSFAAPHYTAARTASASEALALSARMPPIAATSASGSKTALLAPSRKEGTCGGANEEIRNYI